MLIVFSVAILFFSLLKGQTTEFEIHDRGMLWETMKQDGTIGAPSPANEFQFFPSMDWPGGPHVLPLKNEQRSYMVGAGMWMGGFRDGSLFFTENGPLDVVDQGTPERLVKITNYLEHPSYNPNEAEEIIRTSWVSSENVHVQRTSRAWSFHGLNNFIIIEYIFTNRNSGSIDEFYAGFPYLIRPSYQDFVVHNGWGDDFTRADELARYDTTRSLLYAYDDAPNFTIPNDIGNYWDDVDEMRTPGYAGYALLYAEPASDGRSQPAYVLYAQLLNNSRFFSLSGTSKENLYDILTGTDRSYQASDEERLTPFMLMSCGPYNLAPSDRIKIVVVEAVDGLPIEETVEGLSVQPNLPQGLGLLQNTIDSAKELYQNNYVLNDVPPLSPEIEVLAVPIDQSISISWFPVDEDWIKPISGRANFKEYRIYRSERSFIGPYRRIRVIRPKSASHRQTWFDERLGKWVYKDTDINLGVSYYYAVTSQDSTGAESFITNRIETPVTAANPPSDNVSNIKVYPNPFRLKSGIPTPGAENIITWTNLPARCTIRIYTSSGELVRKLEHDNPDIGEEIWNQFTDAKQETAPGIYFWTVESDVGNAKGTLLLIK